MAWHRLGDKQLPKPMAPLIDAYICLKYSPCVYENILQNLFSSPHMVIIDKNDHIYLPYGVEYLVEKLQILADILTHLGRDEINAILQTTF